MLPVEVTVTAPPRARATIPNALLPVVAMPNAPVLLVMVMAPPETKLIPLVPIAGAIAWVRLLTLHYLLVRTVQRWTKVNGERQATTKQQAVRPWWKTDAAGQIVMSIKFGARPIEFEKGKAGIVVGSRDKLPAVIDTLIAAVRAGELDDLFSQAAKTGVVGKPRAARPRSRVRAPWSR
jgi:hypothetical protein